MLQININHLRSVLSVQSKSIYKKDVESNDKDMLNYIKKVINIFNLDYEEDLYGNIYVTKGKSNAYPCVVSHVDTVHDILEDFKVKREGDILYAFSESIKSQVGIGGDDKVGVYLTLKLLHELDNIKVVFFRDEEIGRLGSRNSDKSFFEDCGYIIQPDRKGNSDLMCSIENSNLFSNEFYNKIEHIIKKYNYKKCENTVTDINILKNNFNIPLCMMNLSCGYYRPHTDNEVVSISDVNKCYVLILEIIDELGENKYIHKFENKRINKKDDLDFNKKYRLFERNSVYTNTFTFKTKKPIKIKTEDKCPKCNSKNTLIIDTVSSKIYCLECDSFLEYDPSFFRKLVVIDSGNEFVYKDNNEWIIKDTAFWSHTFKKYILKYDYNDDFDFNNNPYSNSFYKSSRYAG